MTRLICRMLILLMAWMPVHMAQAGMIGTDLAVAASTQTERSALAGLVSRSDVASQLQALGVDRASAQDRVAALTDDEVRSLSGKLDALPAGADGTTVAVIILVGVLIWWLWKK